MEWEKILTNSPKYELYKKLYESSDDLYKYSPYCKIVEYLKSWYSDFPEVCYMFARNLINLPQILKEEKDIQERCRYINFWITDHVRKKLETEWQDRSLINSILTAFLTVENSVASESKNNNCHFDYRSTVTLDLWKEWKDLHDYIRNYNYINVRINSDSNLCKIYFQYFNYINNIHEKYKKECCNRNPSDKCPNRMNLDYFCSDSFFNKLECDVTNRVAADSTEEKFLGLEGSAEGGRSPSVSASLSGNYQDRNGDIMTNNSNYYAKLGVSLSFMGILSAFFYLYKFTTFGNLIRSKILKNEMKINLDGNAQKLMSHDLNNSDENNYTDGYNITYHPS
ncbi:PIR protein [Plasmodium ovale]|uniref:PIR Superfamily Protein n=2 Tax=Plasmodium ovale TaxID=36330 RepID=A0A1A8X7R7_PLAOA|nr:PIR Superfamily Protein [Plasmodium ovale curtisi]SBS99820.1 PIR Superfamily Protein [Plasmodium ovale curtisi]SBT83784.1 PIR protein [Plasmodium ovale]